MKKGILFIAALFVTIVSMAQLEIPQVPEIKDWNDEQEVASKEEEVIGILTWLVSTPLSLHVIERSELNYFVMEWLTRTPTLHLEVQLKSYESDFLQKEEMLVSYIEGCALYGLKHKGNGNQKSQDLAGLKVVAFMAENSKAYYKEAKYKDLIRAVNKGHLDELYDDYHKTILN